MKESEVLLPLRSSLTQIRTTLAAKIIRVRGLMDEVGIGVSVSSLSFYWLELMHKEGEDPLNSHTEIESTNTPSNSNKSNHSNSLKYCEKVNLNDYVKNTKKIGNDERPDGKKEGEEKLFELSFDLHFALKTMHDARKLSLLTGDDNLKDNNSDDNTFNNSSDCHPSNHIRILIEKQYIKDINEDKETKLHESTDEKINCEKNLTDKKSVLSSHSAFGGISVKNQEKIEEKRAELLLFSTIEVLNLSNRWGVCGFQPGNPLKDFQSNGLLALKSLTEFLLRYEYAASQLGEVFVLQRSKYCTYAQVAVQLSKFAADALRLTPTPYTPLGAPLQYLAKQPSWLLLSEQNCYQEVFNLSMLTFDEAWRASTEERGTFPHVDTYEQCLLYVRETLDVIIAAVSTLLICLLLFFFYSLFHFSSLICHFSHSISAFLFFCFFVLLSISFTPLPFLLFLLFDIY
jgi:ELMO/CED-12 family